MEAFRLCPVPGCVVNVWGPTNIENPCRSHGGNRLNHPEVLEDDCWGEPITVSAAAGIPPSGGPPLLEDA